MTKLTPSLLTASLLALGLSTAPSHALNTRSFISANGVDTNACTRPAPCRTLQKAHDSTNPGGEINMLDPAGYGIVTITKAISIVNDGVGSAGILVPLGGTGITINAAATDIINLRGLIIEGAGTGSIGIQFIAGGTLNIQNSVIRRFASHGVSFLPSTSSKLFVSHTLISDNAQNGIFVVPSGSGTVTASLNRVELDNNTASGVVANGANGTGVIKVTVADSVAANNGTAGFYSSSSAGQATTALMLVRCVAADNFYGILAEGTASTVRSAQSTVTGNDVGWDALFGSTLFTYGDNNVDGNLGGEVAQTPLATK